VVTACETVSYPKPNTSKIKGPKKVEKGTPANFKFGSNMAGSAFQCKIDKGKWKACASPRKVATKKLKPGKHKLLVRAGFPKGNWDLTPSKKAFTVTR
jgi:hypothetical protein